MEIAVIILLNAVNDQNCSVYMQERREDGPLDGLFEFPGGKTLANESGRAAAIRELGEETGLKIAEVERVRAFTTVQHIYPDRMVNLNVYTYFKRDMVFIGRGKWVLLDLKTSLPVHGEKFPEANRIIFRRLTDYLNSQMEVMDLIWSM